MRSLCRTSRLQVQRYKQDRDSTAVLQQAREEKVSRLEAVADNLIPTSTFLAQEWSAMLFERKVLEEKLDNHPDVARLKLELQRLHQEHKELKAFHEGGERETLVREVQELRHHLLAVLDSQKVPCTPASAARRTLLATPEQVLARRSLGRMRQPQGLLQEERSPPQQYFEKLNGHQSPEKGLVSVREDDTSQETASVDLDAKNRLVEALQQEKKAWEEKQAKWEEELQHWEEMDKVWSSREDDWANTVEHQAAELVALKEQLDISQSTAESERRSAEEAKDAVATAILGHSRLLEQYVELQERHLTLLSKQRMIARSAKDLSDMADRRGACDAAELKWLEMYAPAIVHLKQQRETMLMITSEEHTKALETAQDLRVKLEQAAESVKAEASLLVQLEQAERLAELFQSTAKEASEKERSARQEMKVSMQALKVGMTKESEQLRQQADMDKEKQEAEVASLLKDLQESSNQVMELQGKLEKASDLVAALRSQFKASEAMTTDLSRAMQEACDREDLVCREMLELKKEMLAVKEQARKEMEACITKYRQEAAAEKARHEAEVATLVQRICEIGMQLEGVKTPAKQKSFRSPLRPIQVAVSQRTKLIWPIKTMRRVEVDPSARENSVQ
eukprot:SM000008S22324  [mRNA]  locus=s8:1079314:1082612:- [translate_table: standard]